MFLHQDIVAIANGEPPSHELLLAHLKYKKKLVAIDGGLIVCDQFDLKPDLICGDFDSLSEDLKKKYHHCPQIYMPDQTQCDLEKTLEYLFSLPCRSVTVLGALGRRIDHTLSNICFLCRYPGKVTFETEQETLMAASFKTTLACSIGQTISLIPFGEVFHIKTEGLKWNLNGENLSKSFVGISNIALLETVTITFEKGDLVVCLIKK